MRRLALLLPLAVAVAVAIAVAAAGGPVPMKFNEVREVAPGVFFRYASISPTDNSVFGGSNNIWVVFEDYVVVIDANFPKEAEDVLAAVRKTTKKPIRYVLDTHHHGDHAWGNAVWVKAGATIVSTRHCARLLRDTGPAEFAAWSKTQKGTRTVTIPLKAPTMTFDDKLVLDDGKQRVEFLHFGHSHTIGDAVAWLPRHGILCTGDACVNGAYNYMGQSDSASWIRCLEKMQQLPVKLVLPGHGLPEGKGLLDKQRRYFVELRRQVKKGIDQGKEFADLFKAIDMPWYKEWTTVGPTEPNARHVYNEYLGLVAPWDFEMDLGIYATGKAPKDTPGWKPPKKVVVPAGLAAAQLEGLKRAAPEIEFLPAKTPEQAGKLAVEADAVIGFVTPEVVRAGKRLRWVQPSPGGVTDELRAALRGRTVALTDVWSVNGPQVAEQTFALLLALTRGIAGKTPPVELRGKTLLLVGLGGTGEQIARRAQAFDMRVRALDDRATEKPASIFSLEKLDRLTARLPEADVVVLALPPDGKTRGLIGARQLKAMKKSAYLVNAAATPLLDLDALAEVMSAKAGPAGVGLDVSDTAQEAKKLSAAGNVVVVRPAPTPEATQRRWRLLRENVRRFAAGEALLGEVELAAAK